MTSHYPIKGIPVDDPAHPPARRDIQQWYVEARDKNSEAARQVSLFIHALDRFQNEKYIGVPEQDAQLSYFRVASIHGFPIVGWNNVGQEKNRRKFCAHNRSTFPTWHRPYLSLYEQLLYKHMLAFLNDANTTYDTAHPKGEWMAAAKNWRLPYWNYAILPQLPDIAAEPTITVITPAGTSKLFNRNPMYSYQAKDAAGNAVAFGKLPQELKLGNTYGAYTETVRYPYDTTAKDKLEHINDALKAEDMPHTVDPKSQGVISENVSRLMTDKYFKSYDTFASTLLNHNFGVTEWLSLENVHNYIHGYVGGANGFMSNPDVAAFDPIFWHHHCFIDMIFHSWQLATNYEKWFDKAKIAKRDANPDPSDDPTSRLSPFFKDTSNDDYYTSNDVKQISSLRYSYERWFIPSDKEGSGQQARLNPQQARVHLQRMVNNQLSMTRSEVRDMLPLERKTDNDLIINTRYNRFGVNNGEAYWIHFFVGEVGEPANYLKNPDRVGSVYNFSTPIEESGCENCQKEVEEGGLATGQVPITGAMLKDWKNQTIHEIPSDGPFDEDAIEEYLKKKLEWRVITAAGQPISVESLPDLKVFVLLGNADHTGEDHVEPVFSDYRTLWGTTANKPGGGQPGDL